MRGGLERWKRGVGSQGVRQALAYALKGSCDSHLRASSTSSGLDALAGYSAAADVGVTRFMVHAGVISTDILDESRLRLWVDGRDPETGEMRGRDLSSPDADLILDGTINAPKSFSIAALLDADLAVEFERLQDRLRDRIIRIWQQELNARRGAHGRFREPLARVEVVELQHRRSRALDPHIHRHLWLGVKVQGVDGKWSNVDSRVAMKLHTVINAEGDLAARTDPQWITALARHGYSLNADGEIAKLAHVVRPLSRRSMQIEANRAKLLAAWRLEHPGLEPGPDQLHRIDRLAWATGRPNKPDVLDETAWARLIEDELRAIDPSVLQPRRPTPVRAADPASVDVGLLAARAVVEADARSASCGGRFSRFDVRAGAIRAVAASGLVRPREDLQQLIDAVVAHAAAHTVTLLADEPDCPAHVKALMASSTAALKVELATRLDTLTHPGLPQDARAVAGAAARVLHAGLALDERQLRAATAIAGTDRLVSVTGPAGAGKTTMLSVAKAALADTGRRMVVVAPTKKAASVAGREIGTAASSLHALLADHGFRWAHDPAGAEAWTRLSVGDFDPVTGRAFDGPRRFPLRPGDRIVVDEAGMVDLHTANALAIIAADTGAGIAMVGDHLQARPVGHSGAMACLTQRATAVVELSAVHRFRDPNYAALTLRMREPASKEAALLVAAELDARGLIHRVGDDAQARDVMVEAYFRWAVAHRRVALVTSTNDEADALNEAIQQRRIDQGQLELHRIAVGQGEQRLLEGDIVQTRRNDTTTDVENRATWILHRITPTGLELVSASDSTDTRTVTHEYAADFVHLAYAATVHGIQGETTDAAIVGPGVDAAGLYVGMTRGRVHNEAIAIARTPDAAIDRVADSMLRGIPEVTIDDAIRGARTELARAARTPPPVASHPPPSPEGDPRRSVHGHMLELARTLHAEKGALLDLDARIAASNAGAHARRGVPSRSPSLQSEHAELLTRYLSHWGEYARLADEYGRPADSAAAAGSRDPRSSTRTTGWGGRASDPAVPHLSDRQGAGASIAR